MNRWLIVCGLVGIALMELYRLSPTAAAIRPAPPDVFSVSPSMDNAATIEQACKAAMLVNRPVILGPGTYLLKRSINFPGGALRSLAGCGATQLVATGPFPILHCGDDKTAVGARIEGLSFTAATLGLGKATGINGQFQWSLIRDCSFWTFLAQDVDVTAIKTTFEWCNFGVDGPVPTAAGHIRIRGTEGSNFNFIRDCNFYHATGDQPSIDLSGGYVATIERCNFEWNRTTVPLVHLHGMMLATFRDNWIENSDGDAFINAEGDVARGVPQIVNSSGNFYQLDRPGNKFIVHLGSAASVASSMDTGNSHDKPFSDNPQQVHHYGGVWIPGYKQVVGSDVATP